MAEDASERTVSEVCFALETTEDAAEAGISKTADIVVRYVKADKVYAGADDAVELKGGRQDEQRQDNARTMNQDSTKSNTTQQLQHMKPRRIPASLHQARRGRRLVTAAVET